MTQRITKRPVSERDVLRMADHLAQRSVTIADRFLDAYDDTLRTLLAMPEMGSRWESASRNYQDLRWWAVKGFPNHIVFYRPMADGIEVFRVLHGARDLENLFQKD